MKSKKEFVRLILTSELDKFNRGVIIFETGHFLEIGSCLVDIMFPSGIIQEGRELTISVDERQEIVITLDSEPVFESMLDSLSFRFASLEEYAS